MANTSFTATGLSVAIYEPSWRGGNFINNYAEYVSSYNHDTVALGGFYTANFQLKQPLAALNDWLERGLGRRVVTKAPGDATIWEGLINSIEANVSGYRLTIGPYLDIANKVKLIYSSIDVSTGVAITGLRVETDYSIDAASVARYGTLTGVLSASGVSDANAVYLLAMNLDKLKDPPRSEALEIPAPGVTFDLTVDCVGYVRMLEKYPYNNATATTVNASDKVKAILQADPNALFSDLGNIAANDLQMSSYSDNDQTAWAVIKDIVAQGDASANRWLFGVYEGRRPYYAQAGGAIKYIRPLREGLSIIQDSTGSVLTPWQVRPGAWVYVTDLLPSRPKDTELERDPRAMFADTVSFRAPDQVTINGAHSYKLEQRLAQWGLGGGG